MIRRIWLVLIYLAVIATVALALTVLEAAGVL
jgi:hypothetical protein